jgi:uncharacterized membrane protein SpoIIM required for sporulation
VDVDAFIAAHQDEWDRLATLVRRRGRLTGPEADELVSLYRQVSTHLAMVRSSAPDPVLLGKLSGLVARARSAVAGTRDPGWNDVVRFLTVRFPGAVYQNRYWWLTVAAVFVVVSVAVAWWVEANPAVQATIGAPDEIRQLVEEDFEDYYSAHPAGSFAAQVWINNAWVAAGCLILGVFLGLPVIYILGLNMVNVAVSAGLMASAGRLDVFFGLITPHGLLELTAVFVAAGAGLRLGWTVIDPGPMKRTDALAQVGRSAAGLAVGLLGVLLISGVIEGFVTPSGLPTWARIGIGVAAEILFIAYIWVYGRRAVAARPGAATVAVVVTCKSQVMAEGRAEVGPRRSGPWVRSQSSRRPSRRRRQGRGRPWWRSGVVPGSWSAPVGSSPTPTTWRRAARRCGWSAASARARTRPGCTARTAWGATR